MKVEKKNEKIKYMVYDVESVPDIELIKSVKFPSENLTDVEAVEKFKEQIRLVTNGTSDFIPVTFQYPVSVCMAMVREDFSIESIELLGEPEFKTSEMVQQFWKNVEKTNKDASIVTFNGRGFDVPIMELMAYRYGYTAKRHFTDKWAGRFRFGAKHIDLQDWLSNFNAIKMAGGLNLLAKLLGMPGKLDVSGADVHQMFRDGKLKEINEYCIFDVLDTYFVFLRTKVLTGEITIDREMNLVKQAKEFIKNEVTKRPILQKYLDNISLSEASKIRLASKF